MKTRYYAIKTPPDIHGESYIWWFARAKHEAWENFFQYPNENMERVKYSLPLATAIEAYQAIGYKCVELDVKEVTKPSDTYPLWGIFDYNDVLVLAEPSEDNSGVISTFLTQCNWEKEWSEYVHDGYYCREIKIS